MELFHQYTSDVWSYSAIFWTSSESTCVLFGFTVNANSLHFYMLEIFINAMINNSCTVFLNHHFNPILYCSKFPQSSSIILQPWRQSGLRLCLPWKIVVKLVKQIFKTLFYTSLLTQRNEVQQSFLIFRNASWYFGAFRFPYICVTGAGAGYLTTNHGT